MAVKAIPVINKGSMCRKYPIKVIPRGEIKASANFRFSVIQTPLSGCELSETLLTFLSVATL